MADGGIARGGRVMPRFGRPDTLPLRKLSLAAELAGRARRACPNRADLPG